MKCAGCWDLIRLGDPWVRDVDNLRYCQSCGLPFRQMNLIPFMQGVIADHVPYVKPKPVVRRRPRAEKERWGNDIADGMQA